MYLQHIIDKMQEAQDAKQLLIRLYYQIDSYSGEVHNGKIDEWLLEDLKKFFKFDDSERE